MSAGLGKVQRKILEFIQSMYQDYGEEFAERGTLADGKKFELMAKLVIYYVYGVKTEDKNKLTLYQKQTVYNALKGLKRRGWIIKSKYTDGYLNGPPENGINIVTYLKDDLIYNFKDGQWVNFKNLIGD